MMCSPALLYSCVVQVLCNILVTNVSLDCFNVAWNPSQLIKICVNQPLQHCNYMYLTIWTDSSDSPCFQMHQSVHSCSSECHAFVHSSFICSTQSEMDSLCVSGWTCIQQFSFLTMARNRPWLQILGGDDKGRKFEGGFYSPDCFEWLSLLCCLVVRCVIKFCVCKDLLITSICVPCLFLKFYWCI